MYMMTRHYLKKLKLKIGWGCGLSYTAVTQQTQNPDFTP
jgi:hypothetical protein